MANLFPSPGGASIKDRVTPTMFLSLSLEGVQQLILERLRGFLLPKIALLSEPT